MNKYKYLIFVLFISFINELSEIFNLWMIDIILYICNMNKYDTK